MRGNTEKPVVIAPAAIIERLFVHVKSSYALKVATHKELRPEYVSEPQKTFTDNVPLEHDAHAVWVPMTPNSEFSLRKPNNISVQAIRCYHSTPTCGYVLIETRQKLKPEYSHLLGSDIAKKRKQGVIVTQTIRCPQLAFICDTSVELLSDTLGMAAILACPVVMIECTFFEKNMEIQANQRGHLCWTHLTELFAAYPSIMWILFHPSQRYRTDAELLQAISGPIPENVVLWGINKNAKA